MAKANKKTFKDLIEQKNVKIPLSTGDELELTVKQLSVRDLAGVTAAAEDLDEIEAQVLLITKTATWPDGGEVTDDDVLDMPLYVMRSLSEIILEFNQMADLAEKVVPNK